MQTNEQNDKLLLIGEVRALAIGQDGNQWMNVFFKINPKDDKVKEQVILLPKHPDAVLGTGFFITIEIVRKPRIV